MKKLFFTLIILVFPAAIFAQNHFPVAVNDTVYSYIGDTVYLNPLINDYDTDGDTLRVFYFSGFIKVNDSLWKKVISAESGIYGDTLTSSYLIKDGNGGHATAKVFIILSAYISYAFSDANNIKALISPFGNHFWDLEEAKFEVPKGSGKNAVFSSALWMGGLRG